MDAIKLFITRPVFTAMLVLAVVVFGLNAYPKIGVDQFPDVDFPVVTVTTVLPGADPETIERDLSDPLEESLNSLAGLETLRSVNVESVSQLVLQFSLEKDVDVAAQDVRDRVQATLSKLPGDAEQPVVEKFDVGAAPILTLALSGALPPQELTRVAEDVLKPQLQRQPGVGSVEVVGGRERELQIVVDPARLRAAGVAASDVVQAVRAQSVDVPGGRTREPGAERVIKIAAEARSVDELRSLVVASPGGSPVRLRDVADVVDGPAEARSSAARDGRPAVALVVRKQSGANTVQVAERVTAALASMQATLPEGARVDVVRDNSRFIRRSIEGVQEDLVVGGLLAVLIVLVFLRSWRSTLVAALALPTSVVGTFAAMHALGYTFNIITMLALTLSIGLLIDDAIVVIENISRHAEQGEPPVRAAHAGTREIALAVLAVTLAILAVFVPVAFMEGIIGRFFAAFGITVAVAVAISYLVSMTLTPMLSAQVLRAHHGAPGRVSRAIERALGAVERLYRALLGWALDHRAVTVAVAVATLVATVAVGRLLQFTFIPAQDMSEVKVTLELPVGTPLERTERELEALRVQVAALPGVTGVFATAGGGVQEEVHKGELLVTTVPIGDRAYGQGDLKAHLRETLRRPGDAILGVQDIAAVGGGGSRPQPVQLNVRGQDWDQVVAGAEKLRARMAASPLLSDVDTTYRPGKPQLTVAIDRDRAASLGIPAAAVGQAVRALLGGDDFATFRQGTEGHDIRLRLPPEVRADPDRIGELTLRAAGGQLVELRNVATLRQDAVLSQIDRQAQLRQITLLADLEAGASLGAAMAEARQMAAEELPPGLVTDFEGQGKELGKTARAFLQALVLGVVLVYMILAAQFGSLVDPLTIMLSLPFAVIGALGALLAGGQFMSMFAMIGMIMLMGLVTKNGILLVEFTNQLREQGRSTREALLEAGPIRLRPILMTTIAMIAGMIPVALARGDGAETRVPMAIAIIGGLVSSTVLTLVVVPVFYALLDRFKRRRDVTLAADAEADVEVDAIRPTGT